jgi:hypothetical protein
MAYFAYLATIRTSIKEKLKGEFSGRELNNKIAIRGGEMWRALRDAKKKEWASKAPAPTPRGKGKKAVSKNASTGEPKVKRALTSYIIFCQAMRSNVVEELSDELKEMSARERLGRVSRELGTMWGTLDEKDKAMYKRGAVAKSGVVKPDEDEGPY